MLTFFTTAKPFRGHDAIIQRNALQSWKLLHPDVDVILFGDDEGAAEVCAEFGLRHEPHVERHESGTKYLNYMFLRAQQISRHHFVCFSNCDIILFSDFRKAVEKAQKWWRKRFLLVGRRWDTDITEPIGFNRPDWEQNVRSLAKAHGFQQGPGWIDFFLFPKGLYLDMPSLIVGHGWWDGWMIWKALSDRVPILDVSSCVLAVHQNHGYAPEFGRVKGTGEDALSQLNLQRMGTLERFLTMDKATHLLTSAGIRRNWSVYTRHIGPVRRKIWHSVLDVTRPVRHAIGLRRKPRPPQDGSTAANL